MTDSEKLDLIILKIAKLDKLDQLEERLEGVEDNIEKIQERLDRVEDNIEKMQERLESVECDVKNIKIILEDEIRQNIRRVAEGHLDLSRNLHKAVKSNNEVEMLAVKVTVLESEVRELKGKIS